MNGILGQYVSPRQLFDELYAPQSLPDLPTEKQIGIPSDLLRRRPYIRRAERELAATTDYVGKCISLTTSPSITALI